PDREGQELWVPRHQLRTRIQRRADQRRVDRERRPRATDLFLDALPCSVRHDLLHRHSLSRMEWRSFHRDDVSALWKEDRTTRAQGDARRHAGGRRGIPPGGNAISRREAGTRWGALRGTRCEASITGSPRQDPQDRSEEEVAENAARLVRFFSCA